MAELVPLSPLAGRLPLRVGVFTLEGCDLGPVTSVAHFAGKDRACSEALFEAHGLGFPAPNRMDQKGDARILWFGRGLALLAGVAPDTRLGATAALTDQSDAWAAVTVSGPGVETLLARLVPVDLGPRVFAPGSTCRTLVGHMAASVTRLEAECFLILVFRSMAETLLHDLQEVMEACAARG